MSADNDIAGQIKAFVDRIERLDREKKEILEAISEIYAEAKANGFDPMVLRKVISLRKQDRNEREEQEAILQLYLDALGMNGAGQLEVTR